MVTPNGPPLCRVAMADVGQPILAAAAFQAASLLVREVSAFQQFGPFPWSSAKPLQKAAAQSKTYSCGLLQPRPRLLATSLLDADGIHRFSSRFVGRRPIPTARIGGA